MARVLSMVVGLGMMANGLAKLLAIAPVVANMAAIHFEGTALRLEGVNELFCGLLVLLPWTRNLALTGLMAILTGAVGAHLGAGQPWRRALPAAIALVVTTTTFLLLNRRALADLLLPRRLRPLPSTGR